MTSVDKISNCDDPDRIGDLIFIHGIGGSAVSTWNHSGEADGFWPAWLGEDLPDIGIWSLDYEASPTDWKGESMPLVDRAVNVLSLLEAKEIGVRPTIFIAHSLGGLLVKQMIRHCLDYGNPNWEKLVKNTIGVALISTPNAGSDLANWLNKFRRLVLPSVSIQELRKHETHLRDLNFWYRNSVTELDIETKVYYEKKPTKGVLIVDDGSADPGIPGVTPYPLDEDHFSIAKPTSKESEIFLHLRWWVKSKFSSATTDDIADVTNGLVVEQPWEILIIVAEFSGSAGFDPTDRVYAPLVDHVMELIPDIGRVERVKENVTSRQDAIRMAKKYKASLVV